MSSKTDRELKDRDNTFDLAFYYNEKTKEHGIEVYDDNDLIAVYTGTDFGKILRHAVYDTDPVLAASAWTKDYLEFSENHNIEEGPEI